MTRQLVLIEANDVDWRLDEHTKDVGLQGIAEARRVLAEAARRASAGASKQAA